MNSFSSETRRSECGKFAIHRANDFDLVRSLFLEYAEELGDDLCFQGFQEELESLPGKYASPRGEILLCNEIETGETAGIVALRPFGDSNQCEMKRMYVKPVFRGKKLGLFLANEIIREAKEIGYREMLLDTLEKLQPAIKLYSGLGFEIIEPYYGNPIPTVVYMSLKLN